MQRRANTDECLLSKANAQEEPAAFELDRFARFADFANEDVFLSVCMSRSGTRSTGYTADWLRRCASALDARPAGCLDAVVPECVQPTGKIAGGICGSSLECASGACAKRSNIDRQCGLCMPTSGEGGDCDASKECAPGLGCEAGKCVPGGPGDGQPCSEANPCRFGFHCEGSPEGTCAPDVAKGMSCLYPWQCAPGLVCPGGAPGGTCVEPGGEGAVCTFGADCRAPLGCRVADDPAASVCAPAEPPAGAARACDDFLLFCDAGEACVMGVCTHVGLEGDPCTPSASAIPGEPPATGCFPGLDCVNGKCAPYSAENTAAACEAAATH
jgi:hypothetical protein